MAAEGTCRFDQKKAVGGIKGYLHPTSKDEDDLLQHVAYYGPSTIGIDASGFLFSLYTSGIYDQQDDCLPSSINHGVCCVGYGEENDKKYWIVRNSWGTSWGEAGYIRMIRGLNICGIASRAYSVYYDNK